MVEEVALPAPLEVSGVSEPAATGAVDLVGNAIGIFEWSDLTLDAEKLALLVVDQAANVGVGPFFEA